MINVLVVDDQNLTHRLIETYLKSEPEIRIVGFSNNGQDAIEQIRNLQPDVVLMDVEMPKMDGLVATKIITQKFAQTKVLILTVHDNEQHLSKALENGAKGYLLKTSTPQELKTAIYYVNQGYFQLSVELTEKYLQKIIKTKTESEEIFDVKRKISYLYKSLNKIEEELDNLPVKSSDEELESKIKALLQQEMAILRDRDSHLQFKVDRMKYNQERLEARVKYLFKTQLVLIVIALIAIIFSALMLR
jgi:DNA-binding NarL/FixJ family response regulator